MSADHVATALLAVVTPAVGARNTHEALAWARALPADELRWLDARTDGDEAMRRELCRLAAACATWVGGSLAEVDWIPAGIRRGLALAGLAGTLPRRRRWAIAAAITEAEMVRVLESCWALRDGRHDATRARALLEALRVERLGDPPLIVASETATIELGSDEDGRPKATLTLRVGATLELSPELAQALGVLARSR